MTTPKIVDLDRLHPSAKVHESSYVDGDVEIGAGTSIWHFCHIMAGSRIGQHCRIGQNVVIGPKAVVGDNVKIQNNVSVYEGVTLEDDVFCGPSVVFTNVLTPRAAFPRNTPDKFLKTVICKGASIGANATIVCGCRVGENALVGAGAVVTRDVAPNAVVYGNPARQQGWACECGGVLQKLDDSGECTNCGKRYLLLEKGISPESDSTVSAFDCSTENNLVEKIPVCDVRWQYGQLKEEIDQQILAVASEGRYILGSNVTAFEREAAEFLGTGYAVGVGNGTDALTLALRALDIGPGDEVVTTPFSFIATAEAISLVGATPVFVDICPKTLNIDPSLIKEKISDRTKAIVPVHLYGQPCSIDAVLEVARSHNLFVVEDCAQAFGAKWRNQRVGTFGDLGCFSFFPTKNLGCMGDGGLVLTNDKTYYERVEMLRRHGSGQKYYHTHLGLNSRLDEIQAAILRVKLPLVDKWNELRRRAAQEYIKNLAEPARAGAISLPETTSSRIVRGPEGASGKHVWHQFTIRTAHRASLQDFLAAAGIATAVYYPTPIHQQPVQATNPSANVSLPHAECAAKEVISLPMYPGMSRTQVQRVTDVVRSWAARLSSN
jgi:dTDP-4-amino-4,6-dideoxygalactose transaminase/acetyltransferase-like isoleucine patch superfamily enzyme